MLRRDASMEKVPEARSQSGGAVSHQAAERSQTARGTENMTETDREHISIREMLEKNGMDLSDSVYSDSAMVDFVVPASGT